MLEESWALWKKKWSIRNNFPGKSENSSNSSEKNPRSGKVDWINEELNEIKLGI